MRLLVDTNVFLEVILQQQRSDEAKAFLRTFRSNDFFVGDFTVYSVGIALFRSKRHSEYIDFLQDTLLHKLSHVASISALISERLVDSATSYNLDCDDAYQYLAAKQLGIRVVSYDSDFNRTPEGRLTPAQVLSSASKP